jgi:molybdate/tungstate transport system substrate-binding protein
MTCESRTCRYGWVAAVLWCVAACSASSERAGRDSAAPAADTMAAAPRRLATDATLTIVEAASLSTPIHAVADSFAVREAVSVNLDTVGGVGIARGMARSSETADVVVAQPAAFAQMLTSAEVTWYARFARDRVVVAFGDSSRGAAAIDSTNWWKVLLRRGGRVGRADPHVDPNGTFPLIAMQLAESHYRQRGLAAKLLTAVAAANVRPTGRDLVASLRARELDYIWLLESTARAAHLRYVRLPHEIDLGEVADSVFYGTAEVTLQGDTVSVHGQPLMYGISIPAAAPNARYAERFLRFLFSEDGRRVLRTAHLDLLSEPTIVGTDAPASVLAIVGAATASDSLDEQKRSPSVVPGDSTRPPR